MEQTHQRMSIQAAVEAIKDEHGISNYRIAKVLDVQQIMIKRYLDGDTKSVSAKVAYNLYKVYGILVDTFSSVEELKAVYESEK